VEKGASQEADIETLVQLSLKVLEISSASRERKEVRVP
jgi:hypothetical protein